MASLVVGVGGFPFQRFSPVPSWQEAWRCAGRRGAEKEQESYIQISRDQGGKATLEVA